MPTPIGAYYLVDLGIKECVGSKLADGDVVEVGGICPWAGKIKAIWAGCSTEVPSTSGTLGVYKSAATNVNLLASATLNLNSGLTANVASSLTLATVEKTLEVAAGSILRAIWTLTNITHDNDAADPGYACVVVIEPYGW
jgi:hypothetical protein